MCSKINVFSEIGKLNKVFLHRPGPELEGLIPNNLQRLLFDDIPYVKVAQQEHDYFANILKENGVEVLYAIEELEKAISNEKIRKQFVDEYLKESKIIDISLKNTLSNYLMEKDTKGMINNIMSGIRKKELCNKGISSLAEIMQDDNLFYVDPAPAEYFTRDPGACIGNGLSINVMSRRARRRESLFLKYIYSYNRDFKDDSSKLWYEYENTNSIEGGDILVLSKNVVCIGCSERTSPEAIQKLAEKLLKWDNTFEKVLVFEIPKCRAFMHLDTVFTMVDYDKFTIHPEIEGPLNIYEIVMDKSFNLKFNNVSDSLENVLKKELKLDSVELIRCGGGDELAAPREQWNDGSNTLAIAPGTVITYDRNYVTNELLDKRGVKVLTMPSSELSRGRGGPRCMSMPIHRDNID